ncbi:non-ribosomal peptide synthetase [Pseudorhodobacter aquimaris]|uniref:non-ribosomal peptide synthetase n=1 Tax=Pseudorhodobacter aquimaris TaxID=687412 RepID=UPI00067C64C1|nr:non-ribosomal peptide synthetase [Pseudorhodobacter aquimaris]
MTATDDIQDVYEMSAAQAGMLFQSLYEEESGIYMQQYWSRLQGPLDRDRFREAWRATINRHDILRARCHWEDLDDPALIIQSQVQPDWQFLDWRGRPEATQESALQDWLRADCVAGFAMDTAPLTRFSLIRMADDAHLFVWSFHHLLLDGWCGALIVREVLDAYAGAKAGPAPRPYSDYIDWLSGQDQGAANAYWSKALAGLSEPTPLGIEQPSNEDGLVEHGFTLGPALSAQIRALGRENRLTLATLMQGAWALVLSRYSGLEDVTFGTVLSGRPTDLTGAAKMIGLFLQTVPVRLRTGAQKTLPWLQSIQTAQRQREEHGHLGLAKIRACSEITGRAALFDSLLIVETYPETILTVADDHSSLCLSDAGLHERTDFALTLKVLPEEDIRITLGADRARIPPDALDRLAGHFRQVLAALAQGAATLDNIDILTAEEHRLIAKAGQGPTPPSKPSVLAQLLDRAARYGNHRAVETVAGPALDYAGLIARAGQIGTALRDAGLRAGDVVAVCQDRTPDLLASLIAVWRAGGAYLPLDPLYPSARVAHILSDSGARMALVDDIGAAALPSQDVTVLNVADCHRHAALPDQAGPSDLAYILYTSGSTGLPKGVPITHGALSNFIASMLSVPGFCEDDRMLALTTVSFDIAALELFAPLVAGGTVVMAGAGAALDGKALARMVEDHRVTVMQSTPAGWRVLRDSGWQGRPGLRMFAGGEALDSALARDLLGLGAELWNLYGPTETTIWSAALQVTPALLHGPKVPVGGPLDHTTLSLRDQAGRQVPVGVAGELWIGGAGLSPGYINRPDQTADRFVMQDGTRHYRTGDRVRMAADGTFDFLGRFDNQIKLRGYRIELGEIEARLESHPGIAQAVVAIRGEGNAARLVAYIRATGPAPSRVSLRAYLGERLPAYMVPGLFIPMDSFPLTPNGKIDRNALPAAQMAHPPSPPQSASQREELVAGIWAAALGVATIDPEDDFFALGGHSLIALRVIGDLRSHLGLEVSLRDLFEVDSFRAFCQRLDQLTVSRVLPAVEVGNAPSLSAAQHRQWLLSRLNAGNADYHLPLAVQLSGDLDIAALTKALTALGDRHDVLRCRFPDERGAAKVEILDGFVPVLERDDISGLAASERAQRLEELAIQDAGTPFDLYAAPPWRARLIKVGPTEHILQVTLHHILADEWSFEVILRDLSAGYTGACQTKLSAQYADFVAWQKKLPLADQRRYWQERLNGAPVLATLPTDVPYPAKRSRKAGRVSLRVSPEVAAGLEQMAHQNGATLFMCLLAAYATFLYRHTGGRDVIIGTPVSNRHMADFHDLVGLFVNTLPMRACLDGQMEFPALLDQIREAVLSAHANQDLPFEQMLEAMSPPRDVSHAPLVQTMFSMADIPRKGQITTDLHWRAIPAPLGRARFDLALEMARGENGLEGHIDFATDLFTPETANRLARRFETLLEALAQAPSQMLCELPILTDADHALAFVPAPSAYQPLSKTCVRDGMIFDQAALQAHLEAVGGSATGQLDDPLAEWVGPPEYPAAFQRTQDGLRPAKGVRAVVLDACGLPAPPGQIGRLALAGPGLARGYAGDPIRSALAFRPNPLVDPQAFHVTDSVLFETGIHAKQAYDGRFHICDAPTRADTLPGAQTQDRVADGPETPVDPAIEAGLTEIWADLLGIAPPDRNTGFFALGGDSILAIQVAARAAEQGMQIEAMDIFRHQTIAALAAQVKPVAVPVDPPRVGETEPVDLDALADLVSFNQV